MNVYLASSWRNKYHEGILKLIKDAGHEVYDFKNPAPGEHGFSWKSLGQGDTFNWSAEKYREILYHPVSEKAFWYDMWALDEADLVVLLLPSGRSAHSEAAYHCGRNKPVIVHLPERIEPELMYKMFNAITINNVELISLLRLDESKLNDLTLSTK